MNKAAQVTESGFTEEILKLLNKAIRKLKKDNLTLKYGKVYMNSLHIRVYANASFGTNLD